MSKLYAADIAKTGQTKFAQYRAQQVTAKAQRLAIEAQRVIDEAAAREASCAATKAAFKARND